MRIGGMTPAQRLARLTTTLVARDERLWPLHRRFFRRYFDALAPRWDAIIAADQVDPLAAALERVSPPERVLDVGTGTGIAAFLVASRFPEAEVTGIDLSPRMIAAARAKTPPSLASRVRFVHADAAALPFAAGAYDLITLSNAVPFFDELARVLAPEGWIAFSFTEGPRTPIWVDPRVLCAKLAERGFTHFDEVTVGEGTCVLGRR